MLIIRMMIGFLLSTSLAWAHPGPSDDKGCHISADTGRKHCHQAKSASKDAPHDSKTKSEKKKKKSKTPGIARN